MTSVVTVWTSATTSLLVPFTTQSNADVAEAAMDSGPNSVATLGGAFLQYYEPAPTVGGPLIAPQPQFLGGLVHTSSFPVNYGLLPDNYLAMVNSGTGVALAVGGPSTVLWSGQDATTLFMNANPHGAAYLGGGHDVIFNAFAADSINITMDSGAGSLLGASTLILDDHVGGSATVTANAGALIAVRPGGADLIIGNSGTVVTMVDNSWNIIGAPAPTIAAAGPGSTLWLTVYSGGAYLTPGAGDAVILPSDPIYNYARGTVTLFGGTQVIGGQTLTAPALTGRVTVAGIDGWLQSGSAGGAILQTGSAYGAATAIAGGSGDAIMLEALGDTANLGDGANVLAVTDQAATTLGGYGDSFIFGNGSGQALGGRSGFNSFTFTGSGAYTVAGFHAQGFLQGSVYRDAVTASGGHITIADFLPTRFGFVFDQFDLGSASVTSQTDTPLGGGFFDSTVQLSDGLTITFANTFGTVHQSGTMLL